LETPLFALRGGKSDDANDLLDIDIKCFESAWAPEEWARIGHSPEYAISVATYYGTAVGFGIFRRAKDSVDVEIVKIAVKAQHRRHGIANMLIGAASEYGRAVSVKSVKLANKPPVMFIIVPESTIYPGPANTSEWLAKSGFKAVKPFLKKHFTAYGDAEDGVKFTAPFRSTT